MRWWVTCLLLSVLPAPAAAMDAPPRHEKAALRWLRADSAASCPSEADVTLTIEQRLRPGALVPKEDASLLVEAALEALPSGGYRVEIALRRGEEIVGRRELRSDDASCRSVSETAALVIALTIDPEASLDALPIVASGSPPVPLEAPPPRPTSRPPSDAARSPATTWASRSPASPWQGDVELGIGIATGTVPNVAAGVQVRGRALAPGLPFAAELEGAYFFSQRLRALPGKGADFTVFHAGAGLCSRGGRSLRLAVMFCAQAQVGAVAGEGYGFASTPRFQTFTFAIAARAALSFRVRPPLAFTIGPWLSVPLKRDYFEIKTATATDELFRMQRLGLGFDLGAVWEL